MKSFKYLLLCAVFFACASSKNTMDENLTGNWELSVFPTNDKTFDEVFGQRRPEIQFDAKKGMVTGNTGCNRLSGSYTSENDRLTFGSNIITTKMACTGNEESVFLDALAKVNRYKVNAGQLQFMHDSLLVMTFVKK